MYHINILHHFPESEGKTVVIGEGAAVTCTHLDTGAVITSIVSCNITMACHRRALARHPRWHTPDSIPGMP